MLIFHNLVINNPIKIETIINLSVNEILLNIILCRLWSYIKCMRFLNKIYKILINLLFVLKTNLKYLIKHLKSSNEQLQAK